jgi:hypothetical protein
VIPTVRHHLNRHERQGQHQNTPDEESTAWNFHAWLREGRFLEAEQIACRLRRRLFRSGVDRSGTRQREQLRFAHAIDAVWQGTPAMPTR